MIWTILSVHSLIWAGVVSPAQAAQPSPRTHAHLLFRGDLDSDDVKTQFLDTLGVLEKLDPDIILIELTGNRARPDLLYDVLDALGDVETTLAVYLRDPGDHRVGPGQLAIALAADRAAIAAGTKVERTLEDDLTSLNPQIEDWAVVGLDLRHAAGGVASSHALPESWVESLVAPRSDMWIYENGNGETLLGDDAPSSARRVVQRSAAGWTFELGAIEVSRVFGVAVHRSSRTLRRSLSLRGRPAESIEIESGLLRAHDRCLVLVARVRVAIGLADAALDVRNNRRGGETLLPRDYHAAADKAAALVVESRSAIAEIESHTTRYPELLWMEPPHDARTPTEIGGPARSSLAAWRDAVRDAERDLARLDDRIAEYRRR